MENIEKLLFIGPPGSGKGTQSKFLVNDYGFVPVSTGEILRSSGNPEVLSYLDAGELAPDELVFPILSEGLPKDKSYILDGSVRTIPQADFAKKLNIAEKVFYFNLSEEVCVERLLNRGEGRSDDKPEVIENRFKVYRENTEPTIKRLEELFGPNFYEFNVDNKNISEVKSEVYGRLGFR